MPRRSIGVLAGAFNPVTRAHLALVEAAQELVEEVLCVVPRAYPHKSFEGAAFDDRIRMLEAASGAYRVRVTSGGLFIEIARELRADSPDADIHFLCGRDAAERILTWDYGEPGMAERMLDEFGLLVAARQGDFNPPAHLRERVRALELRGDYDDVSSTEIRRRIAAGESWEHLVPAGIIEIARAIYSVPD